MAKFEGIETDLTDRFNNITSVHKRDITDQKLQLQFVLLMRLAQNVATKEYLVNVFAEEIMKEVEKDINSGRETCFIYSSNSRESRLKDVSAFLFQNGGGYLPGNFAERLNRTALSLLDDVLKKGGYQPDSIHQVRVLSDVAGEAEQIIKQNIPVNIGVGAGVEAPQVISFSKKKGQGSAP